ncbi:ectoine synthase [Amycolatopsis thermophila]|uniref:L-ectoine synthase n=1 Tax=Amycolatopsis thermophila TaxID=206084 RepID=A0ABU0F1B6_9PSEU|nr:ectoine synthase [Amycolatopsis thermophila]MDQ0381311.1 quercetin dioxygenase-like cupin family protein [Amycolatopsis thermophila]
MIVRSLEDVIGTEREVRGPTWTSRRLVLAREKAGFSVNDTVVHAGAEIKMWYANHIEAVYVIEGRGELVDDETGAKHHLEPGMMYLVDGHERHTLRAHTEFRAVCVFNPPLTGGEVHDDNGVFPLLSEEDE